MPYQLCYWDGLAGPRGVCALELEYAGAEYVAVARTEAGMKAIATAASRPRK
jgi:hypothetical protein